MVLMFINKVPGCKYIVFLNASQHPFWGIFIHLHPPFGGIGNAYSIIFYDLFPKYAIFAA